jgi:hypothetical protein
VTGLEEPQERTEEEVPQKDEDDPEDDELNKECLV